MRRAQKGLGSKKVNTEEKPMWVFGYGSLMWDEWPNSHGCLRHSIAVLPGFKRSFNKLSIAKWGTEHTFCPALNLEQYRSAVCRGVAFEFRNAQRDEVVRYLQQREGSGVQLQEHQIKLEDGRDATAIVPIYIGQNRASELEVVKHAAIIRTTKGQCCNCVDCIKNLVDGLSKLGIEDAVVTGFWLSVRESTIAKDVEIERNPEDDSKRNWRDIEPLLKWGVVSYALGFVTIMFHTAQLGIPVLQVIEPINIWIGFPLTVVIFFVDKIFAYFWKPVVEARQKIVEAWAKLSSSSEEATVEYLAELLTWALPFAPLRSRARQYFAERIRIVMRTRGNLRMPGWAIFLRELALAAESFYRVFTQVLLIVVCIVAYVFIGYPAIPQSYGGGKPIEVQLMVNAERIPKDPGGIKALFRSEPGGNDKTITTVPLMLYYETDSTYYFRSVGGPFISLAHDAVEGLIYTETLSNTSSSVSSAPPTGKADHAASPPVKDGQ
jgi:cation transport protein ChaC